MKKILLSLIAAVFVLSANVKNAAATEKCAYEAQETRITEAITAEDKYFVIEGKALDLFIKNANDLYNIGWVREQIGKVYVIEAEMKAENPHFQVVHVFIVTTDGCIGHYQQTYAAVIKLLLLEDPMKFLRGE